MKKISSAKTWWIVLACCLTVSLLGTQQVNSSGAVVAWGYNPRLETVAKLHNDLGIATISEGSSNVAAVAAGGGHALALRSDGTVFAWGQNRYGQATGTSDSNPRAVGGLVRIGSNTLSNVMDVATGVGFSLALKSNGTVVAWGNNDSGQTVMPASLSNVIAIAAGTSHAIALKHDGTVVNWGASRLMLPKDLTNIVSVAAGGSWHYESNLALTRDGTVIGWGRPVPHGLTESMQ